MNRSLKEYWYNKYNTIKEANNLEELIVKRKRGSGIKKKNIKINNGVLVVRKYNVRT